ncbi:MAG: hypothetical protein WCC89_06975 [Candidatus Sulfotelmatobacter sp.]|jgi:hypothetical protein
MQRTKQFCAELTAELLPSAEKELAAYALAVQEVFGCDESRQSIEDWMQEIEGMDWPSESAIPDWRLLSIAAAVRLARRVNVKTGKSETVVIPSYEVVIKPLQ